MKSFIYLSLFFVFSNSWAKPVWVTTGTDAAKLSSLMFNKSVQEVESKDGIAVLKIDSDEIDTITHMIHEQFNRCSGYFVHENKEEAMSFMNASSERQMAKSFTFADYNINQESLVNQLINQTEDLNILETVTKLSSFQNRYYKSQHGVDSQNWLKSKWEELSQGRNDVKVEFYKHERWPQPSVIMTIQGREEASETIVIGGHADSIVSFLMRENSRAPGADDNASGIATITEVIRIMMENSYVPRKTIKFMAYAAEEVGLLGSKEISQEFKRNNVNVVGALQLDMTNFKGSNQDIVLMTDYTNAEQNAFLGNLIDTYLHLSWGQDKCGYGCSDHASWHQAGYPASIPFEARMREMNNKIHSSSDTLARSNDTAVHAEKFAKLALAYLIELDR